jgi:hypothetical protein
VADVLHVLVVHVVDSGGVQREATRLGIVVVLGLQILDAFTDRVGDGSQIIALHLVRGTNQR